MVGEWVVVMVEEEEGKGVEGGERGRWKRRRGGWKRRCRRRGWEEGWEVGERGTWDRGVRVGQGRGSSSCALHVSRDQNDWCNSGNLC